jgi:ABC-2 family transporter protein
MARHFHLWLPALRRLVLPPLVERELRAGARRPLFYWLRGLLALAAGFQGYELLDRFILAPPRAPRAPWVTAPITVITGATLLHQMAWLLFLTTLLMSLLSADSITRERREGTLGLLLLTDLTPREIVWGKMLSCGLTTFFVLLGAVPALMFPVLAGGVNGSEAALTGLGLLNTLFVVLAAGLWMSTVFRERRYAVPATLGLVAALAFGPEVLGGSYFGLGAVPFFRLFGLAGWMTAAHMPGLFKLWFGVWFIAMNALGWLFLWRAGATLAAGWQDQPHKQVREPEPAETWPAQAPTHSLQASVGREQQAGGSSSPPSEERVGERRHSTDLETAVDGDIPRDSRVNISGVSADKDGLLSLPLSSKGGGGNDAAPTPEPAITLARASWLTDPRPWDANPIRWRVERLGSAEGLIWLAVALSFLAQFGTLGSILNFGAGSADTWGLVSFVGMAVIFFSGGLIAWAGARFFQDTRQQQDLELLLTTPLGSRHILAGQWCVLHRALAWPLGVVLAVALPAGISLLYDFANGYHREFWTLLQPFLICVNLAFEAVALCWVGMRFGLHGRNAITAVAGTVALVQLLPLVLSVALMWGWAWLPAHASSPAPSRGRMPPIILALLFFLAKNLAFILWARLRLRQELRLGSRKAQPDSSAHHLVLQRA